MVGSLTVLEIDILEFKKDPDAFVRKAKNRPLAVLTNGKPTFYVMSPQLYGEIEGSLHRHNRAV